jgi:hypothetical protein
MDLNLVFQFPVVVEWRKDKKHRILLFLLISRRMNKQPPSVFVCVEKRMECIETFPIQILCLRPGILAAVIITSAVEYKTTQTHRQRKPAAEKHFPVRQSQDISLFLLFILFYYFDPFERK